MVLSDHGTSPLGAGKEEKPCDYWYHTVPVGMLMIPTLDQKEGQGIHVFFFWEEEWLLEIRPRVLSEHFRVCAVPSFTGLSKKSEEEDGDSARIPNFRTQETLNFKEAPNNYLS